MWSQLVPASWLLIAAALGAAAVRVLWVAIGDGWGEEQEDARD